MWCEQAQRECQYLQDLHEYKEQAVLRRAIDDNRVSTGEEIDPNAIPIMEDITTRQLDYLDRLDCDQNHCKVVRMLLSNSITTEIKIRLDLF